jgi:hypothetical protein
MMRAQNDNDVGPLAMTFLDLTEVVGDLQPKSSDP